MLVITFDFTPKFLHSTFVVKRSGENLSVFKDQRTQQVHFQRFQKFSQSFRSLQLYPYI